MKFANSTQICLNYFLKATSIALPKDNYQQSIFDLSLILVSITNIANEMFRREKNSRVVTYVHVSICTKKMAFC